MVTRLRSSLVYLKNVLFTFRQVLKIALSVQRKQVVLLLVLSAIVGFSTFPTLYLEKLIIDALVRSVGREDLDRAVLELGILVGATLVISLVANFIQTYTRYLRRVASRYVSSEIDLLVAKKVSGLTLARLEDPKFANRFQKIERESGRRAWAMMMPVSNIPGSVVGLLTSITILFLLHPFIAIGVVIFSMPQLFVDSKYIKKEYELDGRLAPLDRIWGWLNYYLTRNRSFAELKVLNISSYLSEKLKQTQLEVLGARTRMNRKRDFARFGTELPLTIFEFLISLFLIFWVLAAKISIGSFQFYLRTLRSAENYLNELVSSVLELYENYLYVSDLVWLLGLKAEVPSRKSVAPEVMGPLNIEFRNVWFRYKKSQKWVLRDFSLKINPDERIAVVGLNGSGKSTFIKLLCGFYLPQKGEVLINGKNLDEDSIGHWRKSLSVLFQEFESYAFTAQEAIGYGDVERVNDIPAIARSAERTGINQFIEGLPLKYKNPLDPQFEKGVRPSLGQAQRIGIARMFYREDAKLIIMDEPTSSVDPEAEEKIFHEVSKVPQGKTLVFVTQRFSTVRLADRIFVVDKGRVIEDGTHGELMKKQGLYAKLFNLQAKAYR